MMPINGLSAVHTLSPLPSEAPSDVSWAKAVNDFDIEVAASAPGSDALHRAIYRLRAALTKPAVWRLFGACFEPDAEPCSMVGMLIRNHLGTSENGMAHVLRRMTIDALSIEANRVLHALTPEARADMVSRWSATERTSVYVTPNHFIAVQIPGTGLRCSVMYNALTAKGMNLTQSELAKLMTAPLEDRSSGTNALSVLPGVVTHQRYVAGQLLAGLIGTGGTTPADVDRQALLEFAKSIDNAFEKIDVRDWIHVPLAAFFDFMGDDDRAGRVFGKLAKTEERLAPRVSDSDSLRVYLRAANYRSIAASHFEKLASFKSAGSQYREAGKCFSKAGESSRAFENYEFAIDALVRADNVNAVKAMLDAIREAMHDDHVRLCAICERCADGFAARKLPASAALLHILAADYLRQRLPKGRGRESVIPRESHHRSRARHYFNVAGHRGAPQDLTQLLWFAIERRLTALTSEHGLKGQDYVLRFDEASDFISAHEFGVVPGDTWVLMFNGERKNGDRIYDLVTEGTMRKFTQPRESSRETLTFTVEPEYQHPTFRRPIRGDDFIEGIGVIDMILSAPRVVKPKAIQGSQSSGDSQ